MRTLSIVIFSLCCHFASAAEGLEIEGLRLGMSEPAVRAMFPAAECRSPGSTDAFDRECAVQNTATSTDKRYYFLFLESRLVTATVRFPASGFESALKAGVAKYGKPDMFETQTIADRAGAALENVVLTWRSGPHALMLARYSLILPTHSTLELRDSAQDAIVDKRIRERLRSKGDPTASPGK
jgi:hypothetical protein